MRSTNPLLTTVSGLRTSVTVLSTTFTCMANDLRLFLIPSQTVMELRSTSQLSCDVDRNSITVWEGIRNNLKSFAIHVNVVERTVTEVLNPDTVVSNGFVDRMVHDSAYFL